MNMRFHAMTTTTLAMLALASAPHAIAQTPASSGDSCVSKDIFPGPATYKSVEQLADGRVTFRLCAPDAQTALVTSSDIADVIPMGFPPGTPFGLKMTKDASGLWSVTTGKAVPADTYRFNFMVDGARVPNPQGTAFSNERVGTNSVFEVTGPAGDFQTYVQSVPHGTVSRSEYWSSTLGQKREAFVYTPPGYMNGTKRYPVLYLVHGAGDNADSWTSVGRAHYILDNLIAAGKAKPMIIVMPIGHTPGSNGQQMLLNPDFGNDLIKDLIPHIDAGYRTLKDKKNRAMAGLSMGGAHTMRFGLTHPELFDSIGIFSMGLGVLGPDDIAQYETANDAALRRGAKDFNLVYYAMGKDDFLHSSVGPTRAILDKYGIKHMYRETDGGHTWVNWRRYLHDFLPRLFQPGKAK